jgi:nitrite reductase/ring-hydroxylating ferredoxin subunit
MRVDIGSVGDFDEGRMRIVKVNDREIGVVMWNGIPYALRNTCPHQAGPVCAGVITRKLIAGPVVGEIDVMRDDPVLVCPWHGWEFDVRSGRLVSDSSLGIKTYPTHLVGGRIVVNFGRQADDASGAAT